MAGNEFQLGKKTDKVRDMSFWRSMYLNQGFSVSVGREWDISYRYTCRKVNYSLEFSLCMLYSCFLEY